MKWVRAAHLGVRDGNVKMDSIFSLSVLQNWNTFAQGAKHMNRMQGGVVGTWGQKAELGDRRVCGPHLVHRSRTSLFTHGICQIQARVNE